jgi:transposase
VPPPPAGRSSTLHQTPPAATHWSERTMAAKLGIAPSTVHKIWKAHGLKPHLVETFKLSRDPDFVDKVEDVVGLYLDPPDKALVLSVDEKSQIQALDRTQPGLPMKKGRAGTMTHDYERHGTTLFAALNVLTGMVIGECLPRHRHREFLRFLKRIDKETAADLDLHLILDNYATHKTAEVRRWLAAHPRFHLHFTPTSASWLNLVERFFAEITGQRIRRGVFNSVADLEKAIMDYLEQHNANPKPFAWTASAGAILEKVARAKQALRGRRGSSASCPCPGSVLSNKPARRLRAPERLPVRRERSWFSRTGRTPSARWPAGASPGGSSFPGRRPRAHVP